MHNSQSTALGGHLGKKIGHHGYNGALDKFCVKLRLYMLSYEKNVYFQSWLLLVNYCSCLFSILKIFQYLFIFSLKSNRFKFLFTLYTLLFSFQSCSKQKRINNNYLYFPLHKYKLIAQKSIILGFFFHPDASICILKALF